MALTIAVFAFSLFLWYCQWDVQHISHWARGQFGDLGVPSPLTDSRRESVAQFTQQIDDDDDDDDDRWARALLGTMSTLGSYATERPASQTD